MNRFDICEAFYVYATLHHRGQGSKEYAIFGRLERIGFRPATCVADDPDKLTDDGKFLYERLVSGESKVR